MHLLCNHREHGQFDSVELVETSPEPRLAQPLKYLGHVGVALLVGAVCDHLSQQSSIKKGCTTCGTRIVLR